MKSKYFVYAVLTIAFLSSFIPSGKNNLEIGKEAPIETLMEHSEIKKATEGDSKNLLINFWNPNDPQSRVRNIEYARLANNLSDNDLILVSVCLAENTSFGKELVKIDKIEGENIINLSKEQINSDLLKEYQVESGNRSFLIDKNGILKSIMPETSALNL